MPPYYNKYYYSISVLYVPTDSSSNGVRSRISDGLTHRDTYIRTCDMMIIFVCNFSSPFRFIFKFFFFTFIRKIVRVVKLSADYFQYNEKYTRATFVREM